jgi:hypothetical protein
MRKFSRILNYLWPVGQSNRVIEIRDLEPIFICGASGSGTTLLTTFMMQHYEIGGYVAETATSSSPESLLYMRPTATHESVQDYYNHLFLDEGLSAEVIRNACFETYQYALKKQPTSKIFLDKASNCHLVRAKHLKQAFPKSKFIFILRDPICNVEGFWRKWFHIKNENFESLCQLWAQLHETFLKDTKTFRDDILGITYEAFVQQPHEYAEALAKGCNLKPRNTQFKFKDKANKPGRGLRNVVSGSIEIVKDANTFSKNNLTEKELNYIAEQLTPLYETLKETFEIKDLSKPLIKQSKR